MPLLLDAILWLLNYIIFIEMMLLNLDSIDNSMRTLDVKNLYPHLLTSLQSPRQWRNKDFDFKKLYSQLLTPEIVALLIEIHEHRGQQNPYIASKKKKLSELSKNAKFQSIDASNRLDGYLCEDEKRFRKLVLDKTMPKNRAERSIAGYRDVLNTIHEYYDYLPLNSMTILEFHRDLYKFERPSFGGAFKNSDNSGAEKLADDSNQVISETLQDSEAPHALRNLCDSYSEAFSSKILDPLLVVPVYILDFLCIQPFDFGNFRLSRLISLLLLQKSGFLVGKFISIEKIIIDSQEKYFESLKQSSEGWLEGTNDYLPFVKYMLNVIVSAYRSLSEKIELLVESKGLSKFKRVKEIIRESSGNITKTEIAEQCSDISHITIQRALSELISSGTILKIGGGRYTSYAWNLEKN